MQPKLIYLARRRRDMTRQQFIARWRQHGALGMSRPRWVNIARYVHCDVLDAAAGHPGISDAYDGVGLIWHRSPEARAAHRADASSQRDMEIDERETFLEPIVDVCLLAREIETMSTPTAGNTPAVKMFRFLTFEDESDCDEIGREMIALRREMPSRSTKVSSRPLRHCLNLALPAEAEGRASWGLDAACVEEFWFECLDALAEFRQRCAADPGMLATGAAEPISLIEIVTNEVVLYEANT